MMCTGHKTRSLWRVLLTIFLVTLFFLIVPLSIIGCSSESDSMAKDTIESKVEAATEPKLDSTEETKTAVVNNGDILSDPDYREWGLSLFDVENESLYFMEELILENINDEDSYRHIETQVIPIKDDDIKGVMNDLLSRHKIDSKVDIGDIVANVYFSASNEYGARTKYMANGIAHYRGNTIELIVIEETLD